MQQEHKVAEPSRRFDVIDAGITKFEGRIAGSLKGLVT